MDRLEAERILESWKEQSHKPGFQNKKVPASLVLLLLEAVDVLLGVLAKAAPVVVKNRARKRLGVDPTTSDHQYTDDEVEFLAAIQDYKQQHHRPWPAWSEVLEVVLSLGYRKRAQRQAIEPDGPSQGDGGFKREYRAWDNMRRNRRGYPVCEAWRQSFKQFLADMGPCPDGYVLWRMDKSKGFQPDNCEWAPDKHHPRA